MGRGSRASCVREPGAGLPWGACSGLQAIASLPSLRGVRREPGVLSPSLCATGAAQGSRGLQAPDPHPRLRLSAFTVPWAQPGGILSHIPWDFWQGLTWPQSAPQAQPTPALRHVGDLRQRDTVYRLGAP